MKTIKLAEFGIEIALAEGGGGFDCQRFEGSMPFLWSNRLLLQLR